MDMNFQSNSRAKTNTGPAYQTRRPEAGRQVHPNIRSICPPGGPDTLGEHNRMEPVASPREEAGLEAGERAEIHMTHGDDARTKLASLRGSKRARPDPGWLARDPSEWTGRKIRHRLTGKVYEVRTVFVTGRVELQKSWMTYMSHVWTIRAEFETYSG